MTNLKTRIATAIATSAVLMSSITPAFAATTLTISGNGSNSDNDASVTSSNTTVVSQSNNANVTNDVSASAETGNNHANDNTGGNVDVHTGDAVTTVRVNNDLNSNVAQVDTCCNTNTDIVISGNGSKSENEVELTNSNSTTLFQDNNANVRNKVSAESSTGDNRANDNTGGNVTVHTGMADTLVNVKTEANSNVARIGGGTGASAGTVKAWITGNGGDSENEIELSSLNDVLLTQTNNANVYNRIDAESETGDNHANDNTGGAVAVWTGDAITTALVDNMVNFNAADVSNCGCLSNLEAKIAGNGSDSESEIEWTGDNTLLAFQDNVSNLNNHVKDVEASTGENRANDNTGAVHANDPYVHTGNGDSYASVKNTGNSNVLGDGSSLLHSVDFSFDFSGLMSFFLGH